MPSLFKKSNSDTITLSETYRKVLHKCRMLLIKDLEVTDILEFMSSDDVFKSDVRDSILTFPTREQRTGNLLDRLETKGDRAFGIFMEALREHYKHLHYALEEALRTVHDKRDSNVREYQLSISGDTVRRYLRNNMRRKAEYSHGSESVDDMDVIFDERDDTYIDCYAIPMRGRLHKEKWIKKAAEPKQECRQDNNSDDGDTYMGAILRDLLFKKIEFLDIPDGVRKPPVYSSVYVLDKDNKYGLIRKQPKERHTSDNIQSGLPGVSNTTSNNLDMDVILDNDWANEELPDYTAPPPPIYPPSSPGGERHRNDSGGSDPPPPLPPKPGNLPPLNIPPLVKAKPPEPPPNEITNENGEVVKPPPRSTSLAQTFENKPLPLPTRKGSKLKQAKLKERNPSGSSMSEKSPQNTPAASPPIPPRKYIGGAGIQEGLIGAGALAAMATNDVTIAPPVPEIPPPEDDPELEPVKQESSSDLDQVDLDQVDLDANDGQRSLNEVTEECDFDPYSLHADHVFQVRGEVNVKASSDVASEGETATGSSNATLTQASLEVEQNIPVLDDQDYETVAIATHPQCHSTRSQAEKTRSLSETEANGHANATEPTSRDSTPFDSDDMQHDTSRDMSNLEDSFKASGDSLDSVTSPGSQEIRSDVTTDSGIGGASVIPGSQPPPMLKQVPGNKVANTHGWHRNTNHKDSVELSEVQVLADGDSSDANSYYEDIDAFDDRSNPIIPLLEPSERTSVSYLDPKTYFKAIEKMAQQGLCKEGTLKRIAIVEEWEASGRALLSRDDLVVAEITEAYSVPKPIEPIVQAMPSTSTEDSASQHSGGDAAESEQSSSDSDHTPPPAPPKDPYDMFRFTTIVFDKLGRAFYVPSKHVRRHGDPDGEPWYYPIEISSHQATLFLGSEKQEGCFLVYKPKNKQSKALYNLSVCRGSGDVVHYHIVVHQHRDIMLEGHDHTFLNVVDLVHYFQRNKSQLATKLRRPLKEATLPITPGYHYELQWEVSRSHLNLTGRILGKGNYGVVCAGLYHKHIPVAVKVLQNPEATILEEDEFIEEAKCLMGLNHEHVVRFVGLSCTAKPFFLVTEYLPKGNLKSCLQNNIVPSDNIEQLFDVSIQVTSAMEYLESRRFVLHRDLAARNFLVADHLCVKLADFGRARYVVDDYYQAPRDEKIPIKWASPEVLVDSHYSTKSDVWALGVVFWEILSGGERPYDSFSGEQTAVYVTEGGRLEKPVGCPMDLYNTMKRCWCENADDRPSFHSLLDKLKSKSSIYYSSSPVSNRSANSTSKPSRRSSAPVPNTPKSITSSSFAFGSRNGQSTAARKKTHTVMVDTRSQDIHSRRMTLATPDLSTRSQRPYSGERNTSGSETSLTSAMERDELSRGGKIRKSIRKMISIRTKKKPPGLEGLKEDSRDKAQNMYGSEF